MIDLHTHLLPDWDDGAKNWEEMEKMAEIAWKDGIQKIALTPHVYRLNKGNSDIPALKKKMAEFMARKAGSPISFYEGTEVFVHAEIVPSLQSQALALNNSNYFFIEFPSDYILPGVKDLFFKIMLGGFIPIISHPERNTFFQERPDLLYELIKMDCPAQVTAKSLTGEFGPLVKKAADLFLTHNLVHVIASDAHDAVNRPPVLSRAVQVARKIVGEEKALAMVTTIPQAILDNKGIGDWGEPVDPVKAKKWTVRVPRFMRKSRSRGDGQEKD